jgi:hypothetical protein
MSKYRDRIKPTRLEQLFPRPMGTPPPVSVLGRTYDISFAAPTGAYR